MNILASANPTPQASTNTNTIVSGSILGAGRAWAISYTIVNSGDESIDFDVIGGNEPDLSDGIVVQVPATIASAGVGSYSTSFPLWKFYGIRIESTTTDQAGEATINGIIKG